MHFPNVTLFSKLIYTLVCQTFTEKMSGTKSHKMKQLLDEMVEQLNEKEAVSTRVLVTLLLSLPYLFIYDSFVTHKALLLFSMTKQIAHID